MTARSSDGAAALTQPASFSSAGRAKMIADWKPPKPLPVDSAASTSCRRATLGV